MRKNKMMRTAAVLLVAVLLTTCAISGTFAKYTSTGSAQDSARVAKWGVTVTCTDLSAFSTQYSISESEANAKTAGINYSVSSSNDVIAPGTSGNLANFTLSGTPEVAVKVEYAATVTLSNWTVNNTYYCPLIINVGGTEVKGTDYKNVSSFQTAIANEIAKHTSYIEAGKDLSKEENWDALDISWYWGFETTVEGSAQNENDTALGNAAADTDTANDPSFGISITVTVTQVD